MYIHMCIHYIVTLMWYLIYVLIEYILVRRIHEGNTNMMGYEQTDIVK